MITIPEFEYKNEGETLVCPKLKFSVNDAPLIIAGLTHPDFERQIKAGICLAFTEVMGSINGRITNIVGDEISKALKPWMYLPRYLEVKCVVTPPLRVDKYKVRKAWVAHMVKHLNLGLDAYFEGEQA